MAAIRLGLASSQCIQVSSTYFNRFTYCSLVVETFYYDKEQITINNLSTITPKSRIYTPLLFNFNFSCCTAIAYRFCQHSLLIVLLILLVVEYYLRSSKYFTTTRNTLQLNICQQLPRKLEYIFFYYFT